MMAARAVEMVDRRVFAALRFVDSAGRDINSPVAITAVPPIRVFRNRSGLAIVASAAGLSADESMFDAPSTSVGSLAYQLSLRPFDRGLAPRSFVLSLPRDPQAANSSAPNSLFRPIDVELLASTDSVPSGQAAAVRVTVARADDQRRVAGALVRIETTNDGRSARGVTNQAGEALLLIYGLPLSAAGAGATVVSDHAANLDMIVDPMLVSFHDETAFRVNRSDMSPLIDPDDIETRLAANATAPQPIRIAAGKTSMMTLDWSPP